MFIDRLDAEECDNGSEQGNTLDQGGCHDHVGKQFAHHLWLTGHGVHSLTTNLTNSQTSTNGCETCAYCGTQLCYAFYG